MTLPEDFDLAQALAIGLLFGSWFAYSKILRTLDRGSLNEQLSTVRARWLTTLVGRAQKPFDAILLGHIVNSIAFFGSATLIVLAGVVSIFASVRAIYGTVSEFGLTSEQSFALFVTHIAILNVILALSFFSFIYALRKLIYVIALVGALPEGELPAAEEACRKDMVEDAATVLSEALKTFNFGIRGYYYSIAGLGLFVSPWLSIAITVVATGTLMYRQIGTRTAAAIRRYVEASNRSRGH